MTKFRWSGPAAANFFGMWVSANFVGCWPASLQLTAIRKAWLLAEPRAFDLKQPTFEPVKRVTVFAFHLKK